MLCGGDHSPAYGDCIVQKEAREIQKVKITHKISYAEALKKVREEGANNRSYNVMAQRNTVQSNNNTPGNQVQTQGPMLMQGAYSQL